MIIFLTCLYLQCFLLIALIINLVRIKNTLARRMRGTVAVGLLTCVSYSINCFPVPAAVAHLMYGIYYASVTALMMHMTSFTHAFTGVQAKKNIVTVIEYLLTGADMAILIYLSLTQKLITPVYTEVRHFYMWEAVTKSMYFNVHLGICYLFCLKIVCLFAIKMSLTSRQQRSKYLFVLWGFSSVLFTNALYLLAGFHYDISLFGYGILSVTIFFFSFVYVPRNLVNVALANALQDMQGILICFDMDGNCVYLNEVAIKYLHEIHHVTANYQAFCNDYLTKWSAEHPSFFTVENEAIVRNMSITVEDQVLQFEVKAKRSFDDKGLYLGCYFNIIDKTEEYRRAKERELENRIDPLSGYLSRAYFFEQVRSIILQNPETDYYLTCSNIVDFKIFNSIYGEEQGNQVLQKCAKAIENADTKMVLYGRISGDLFGFLLKKEDFNERAFHLFVSNLQDEFSNTFYKMHIQYGLYLITNRNEPISSMCEKVTLSMKKHKTEYDRIIFFYNENDLDISLNEKKLLGRFDTAMMNDEITIFLQPQVSGDDKLVGAEALVRWIEPDGTINTPDTFVPLLERNGLISRVDLYVWNLAAQQLSSWAFMGREDLTISINISVKDFYYLDLYKELTELVEEYQINPKNLCLEITETTIIQDIDNINAVLQHLRDYGFTVEIDDFGNGYSSLGMLKEIEVDVLKLDMSFLQMSDPSKSERTWIIMEEILRMAKNLNMKTIVEGVEIREQVERLKKLGCDNFQGFYYAQPEPLEHFERRLQNEL
ncbi:MAG: EAL domain-containing protein [Treponemataceae bacterium]|nr:EAL domain-containing protein [Treponemataceae bacterium]